MTATAILIPQAPSALYGPVDPAESVVGGLLIVSLVACVVWFRRVNRKPLLVECKMCGQKHYRSDMVTDPYGYFCSEDEADEYWDRSYL